MKRLMERLLRLGERSAAPLDEATWRRRRNGAALWLLVLAGALAVQTAILQSPDYMINGLYHNRRTINLQLQTMPEAQRTKLMERLCLSHNLFDKGGVDPYQIPDAEGCATKYKVRVR